VLLNINLLLARHCLLLLTEKEMLGDELTVTSMDVESLHPNWLVAMRVTV